MKDSGLRDCDNRLIREGHILFISGDYKVGMATGLKFPSKYWAKFLVGFEKGCYTLSVIEQENYVGGKIPSSPTHVFHTDLTDYKIIDEIEENTDG